MRPTPTGKNWAFLATEANYRWLKDFESKNLLVPVVGNFAGPEGDSRRRRSISRITTRSSSAFYTSNVEQYLLQQGDDWRQLLHERRDAAARLDEHVHPVDRRRVRAAA